MRWLKSYALYFAWVIALSGTMLSLYFGELLRYEPCRLCWYQRIFLFPLAIILGIGAYRQEGRISSYALPLCLLGGAFSLYQVLEIYVPSVRTPALCGYINECSNTLFELWGFITFPLISLVGFVAMIVLLWVGRSFDGEEI